MQCKNCGTEMSEGAVFCPSCGQKAEGAEATGQMPDANQEAGAAAEAGNNAIGATQTKSWNKPDLSTPQGKKKMGIMAGAAVAVVVAVVAVVMFALNAGKVPGDIVKQDVSNSYIVASGIVPSDYVDYSPYELTDFKVTGQEKQSLELMGMRQDVQVVTFEGTEKNANFETKFTGTAQYTKQGDSWIAFSGPSETSHTATPLKGVDSDDMTKTIAEYSGDEALECADFSSTLDEASGTFTSTATGILKGKYWFATDSASYGQTFKFDQNSGWAAQDEPSDTDDPGFTTEWAIKGKTFTGSEKPDRMMEAPNTPIEYSVTIDDISDDGTVSATYSVKYAPVSDSDYYTYFPADLNGTLTGKMDRKAFNDSFKVELNDPEQQVTIGLQDSEKQTVAGMGTQDTIYIYFKSNFLCRTWKNADPGEGYKLNGYAYLNEQA